MHVLEYLQLVAEMIHSSKAGTQLQNRQPFYFTVAWIFIRAGTKFRLIDFESSGGILRNKSRKFTNI